MIKKRSPKEIIESNDNPKVEHAYVKFPGQQMIETTISPDKFSPEKIKAREVLSEAFGINRTQENSCVSDEELIKQLQEKHRKRYMALHTHPYLPGAAVPSASDLYLFLQNDDVRTRVIISQDSQTGKLRGYTMLRKREKPSEKYLEFLRGKRKEVKSEIGKERIWMDEMRKKYKKPPPVRIFRSLLRKPEYSPEEEAEYRKNLATMIKNTRNRHHYSKFSKKLRISDISEDYESRFRAKKGNFEEAIKPFIDELDLQYRFVPAQGYYFDRQRFREKGLENKALALILCATFIISILFSSTNLTGNAIGNLNSNSTSAIGIILFLVGLIGTFFYFRKKK